MMMLITPTLLNAFRWYTHFYGEEPEDETIQREDFLRTLRREPIAEELVSEAMLRGRELERRVEEYCKAGGNPSAPYDIRYIGDLCMGAKLWQLPVKRVMDGKFMLYGRVDRMQANFIDDIKFCGKYDIGKFVKSAQHPLYLWCSEMSSDVRFRYLISDGREAYVEEYANVASTEGDLRGKVHDFMGYLNNDPEAKELYNHHWKAMS